MALVLALVVAAGCGRFGFDGSSIDGDAPAIDGVAPFDTNDTLMAECTVYLAMDESTWGGGTSVANGCAPIDGVVKGNAHVVDDATRGRVGEFGGDPDCVELGNHPLFQPTDQVTMSAWVRGAAFDGVAPFGIISKRVGYQLDSQYTLFVWTGDEVFVDIDGEDDRFGAPNALANATWTQVTAVYDGRRTASDRVRVYRNGALDVVAADQDATIAARTGSLDVGCMPDMQGSEVSWNGRLDDVAVWSRALDDTEVAAWYARTSR